MPLSKYHTFTGILAATSTSIIAAVIMHSLTSSLIGASTGAAISFFFTLAGSIAPDIDHKNSYVFRLFKLIVFLVTVIVILYLQYHGWGIIQGLSHILIEIGEFQGLTPTQLSLIISLSFLMIVTGTILEVIEAIQPVHRGITHKIWTNTVFGILMFPGLYFGFKGTVLGSEPGLFAAIASISWVIGAALHKLEDYLFRCA